MAFSTSLFLFQAFCIGVVVAIPPCAMIVVLYHCHIYLPVYQGMLKKSDLGTWLVSEKLKIQR
jgi:hypothetical protein